MDLAQQALDRSRKIEENLDQVREKVMKSYHDIATGKGRDFDEFFDGLARRYSSLFK